MAKHKRINTPWGYADRAEHIADGIKFLSTPSHGGLFLTVSRREGMPAYFRDHNALTKEGWYEEDCEWAMVALVYREHFQDRLDAARRTMARWFPALLEQYDAEHDPRRLAMAATDHIALYVAAIRSGAFPRIDFEAFRHPVLGVPCSDCDAKPGSMCKRPSGHEASDFHKVRKQLADAVFIEQHGEPAWIERHNDGTWSVHEEAAPKTELTECGEQYVMPGCEKKPTEKNPQGSLW